MAYIIIANNVTGNETITTIKQVFMVVSSPIADAWIGHYKVILTSLLLPLLSWILHYAGYAAKEFEWPDLIIITINIIGFCALFIANSWF